jgi:hypothetical protein
MTWQDRFDRLLKAMAHGEPPKGRRVEPQPKASKAKPEKPE